LAALSITEVAFAQKQGGILRISHFDSPASMSLHEEATAAANRPMMGVFNNLVMYKQDVPQNSMQSIVPDLADSWSWSEEGTELTFPLRQSVKWHDGRESAFDGLLHGFPSARGIIAEHYAFGRAPSRH
jgi:peptide/nickel transport system substrate-binding protein